MPEIRSELQGQIVRYLQRNARAAETPEGVNGAWLGRPQVPGAILEVEQALEGLVRMRQLERHELPGGIVIYRRSERGPAD